MCVENQTVFVGWKNSRGFNPKPLWQFKH